MDLTKEQLFELICKHTEKENGLQDLLEIMLESLMVSDAYSGTASEAINICINANIVEDCLYLHLQNIYKKQRMRQPGINEYSTHEKRSYYPGICDIAGSYVM